MAAAGAGKRGSGAGRGVSYYVDKIRQGDAATWHKDELLNVIYWWRQVQGILFGLAWGAWPAVGLIGFATYLVFNMMLTVAMYKSILGIDEEEYGGHSELLQEGMQGSLPSFLLTWILTYTALHT